MIAGAAVEEMRDVAVNENGKDERTAPKRPVDKKLQSLKDTVLGVLEETDFATLRATHMSIDNFTTLLNAFNAKGVRFS